MDIQVRGVQAMIPHFVNVQVEVVRTGKVRRSSEFASPVH